MNSINKKRVIIALIVVFVLGIIFGKLFGGSTTKPSLSSGTKKTATTKKKQYYTCSMHPQIHLDHPGNCPICGMDLIPETKSNSADTVNPDALIISNNAQKLSDVETVPVKKTIGRELFSTQAKIDYNKKRIFNQVSQLSGRIEKLYRVNDFRYVKKGTKLYEIYSPQLLEIEQELIQSEKIGDEKLKSLVLKKFKNLKISQAHIEKVQTTKVATGLYDVLANFSGDVIMQMKDAGDYIKKGEMSYKFAKNNLLWGYVDIYQRYRGNVHAGDSVYFYTDTYRKIPAKILSVSIQPSGKNGIIYKAIAPIHDKMLEPGMVLNADIIKYSKRKVLLIPNSAVLWSGKRSVVYTKVPNSTSFLMHEVSLGRKFEKGYEVLSGLKEGDLVVYNGAFAVDAASQLAGKKSLMNRVKGQKPMTMANMKMGTDNKKMDMNNDNNKMEKNNSNELNKILGVYLNIKNALVKDDVGLAQKYANIFMHDLHKSNIKDKELMKYSMLLPKQKNIEELRKVFKPFSASFINYAKTHKVGKKVYIEFCPMFDQNKGAYWISTYKKIKNPYYGKKMLSCGNVKQTLK